MPLENRWVLDKLSSDVDKHIEKCNRILVGYTDSRELVDAVNNLSKIMIAMYFTSVYLV